MSLAKNIVRARKRAKLTQAELAKKLGKSRASVNEWESGNHKPRGKMLRELAKVLGCDLSDLASLEELVA